MSNYCSECGKEVEEDMEYCPKCGNTLKENTENKTTDKIVIGLNLKTISYILGIIAIFLAIVESANVLRISAVFGGEYINGIMGLIMSLTGIYGLYISKYNLKTAGIQYILTGIGVFISIYLYGVYPAILLIIVGIVTLIAYKKDLVKKTIGKKELIIPVLTIILFGIFLIGSTSFAIMDDIGSSNSLNITDLKSNINNSYGTYSGDLKGNLHVSKDFDYLDVVIEYYDANNVSLYKSYAYTGNNVKQGTYEIDGFYYNEKAPIRAEIRIYDDISSKNPIYTHNVNL